MWPLWKVRVSCEKKVYVKVKVVAVVEDQGFLVKGQGHGGTYQ